MIRTARLLIAAALALAAVPALAQAPVAPSAMVGAWDLSKDGEGAPTCRIALSKDTTIGGFAVAVPKTCAKVTKNAGDIYAWRMNGKDLAFADPLRHTLLTFASDGQGTWSTAGADHLLLSKPSRTLSQAERMRGHWRLVALGGVPLCDFDLTSNPAGTAGTLRAHPTACKAPWVGRSFARWELKARRISLIDDAGKTVVAINDCGLGGCTGELPNGDFIGLTPQFDP
jgi:hypothetical protein